MKYQINPKYAHLEKEILALPEKMNTEGVVIQNLRNVIKIMHIGSLEVNIKSFKRPHWLNRLVYAYIRPSKAFRSFVYANKLTTLNVATPESIAYILHSNILGVTDSYYISVQEKYDFTFETLMREKPEDLLPIVEAFTTFTFDFHTKGVFFIDHSPANTLIKRLPNGKYDFKIVDLNRMEFKKITPYVGLKNFSKLRTSPEITGVIARKYAILSDSEPVAMEEKLNNWVNKHNARVRQNRIRKGLSPDY